MTTQTGAQAESTDGAIGVEQHADDVCALPLVRRLAATLDLDPSRHGEGDPLPHGWHLAFFSVDTPHSGVRADGLAGLGVKLPDLGLPRIVFGGRTIRFHREIPIGSPLRRVSKLLSLTPKDGRSGRLTIAQIQHEIFVGDASAPAITELHSYVMREAASAQARPAAAATPKTPMPVPAKQRIVVPDEILLFRVSAVMFNPHRIHYDLPFARDVEGYPALVVNGSVSSLLLLQFYREQAGREADYIGLRNVGLAFCGRPLRLNAIPSDGRWRMWADSEQGEVAVEGEIGAGLQ